MIATHALRSRLPAYLLTMAVLSALPLAAQFRGGGHVRMRVTAIGTSPSRGQNLVVQLAPEHPGMSDTLLVHFPAHSFTRKEAELAQLFSTSCKRDREQGPVHREPMQGVRLIPADSLDILLKVPRRNMSFRLDEWHVVRVTTK